MQTKKPAHKGHRQLLEETAENLGFGHLLSTQLDDLTKTFNWNKFYKIDSYSFSVENPKRGFPTLETDCNIYTDGSRLGPFRSGAAISVWKTHVENETRVERPIPGHDKTSFYLEDSTIFQCETFGVLQAANWLATEGHSHNIKKAIINVDSQACIKALGAPVMTSKLLYHTVQTLNEAAKHYDITIRWIKAHLDDSIQHRGNAFADASAKQGAIAANFESLVHPDDIPRMSLH